MRLTKRSVEQLATPDCDCVVWDTELSGFGVRLLKSGRKTYVMQRRTRAGRSIRLKIARVGDLSCEMARDEARQLVAQIVTGGDPAAKRRADRLAERERRAAPTVDQLLADWCADRRGSWRPASAAEIERQIRRYISPALGRVRAGEVRQRHVKDLHASLPAIQANRVVATVRAAYSWAIARPDDWPSITANPALGVQMNREERRERFPQNGELKRSSASPAQ